MGPVLLDGRGAGIVTDVPHLAFPFEFAGGSARENEQDSVQDIAACVAAIVLTPSGAMIEAPEFGSTDLPFLTADDAREVILAAVAEHEPRATLALGDDEVVAQALTIRAEVAR